MSSTDFKTLAREMRGREGIRGSLLMLVILLFLAMAVTWASLTEIDNVTRGEGEIVSAMQNQLVQAAQAGVLLERYVSEGDAVAEGDVLFEIDPVEAMGELDRIRQRYSALQIKEIRLRAEIADRPMTVPPALEAAAPSVAQGERDLYRSRRAELDSAVAILEQKMAQRQQDLARTAVEIRTAETTAALLTEEIDIIAPLVAQEAAPRTRLLDLQRRREEARGQFARGETSRLQAEAALMETREELRNRREQYARESTQELAAVVAEKAELEKSLPALESRVTQTTVRAPLDGKINRINFRTRGAFVQRGDVLLEMVPTGESLIVEAKIAPQDRSSIRPDADVILRFSAYDSSRFGTVDGRVLRISPDAVRDEQTGTSHYIVDIAIVGGLRDENGDELEFIPGMTATVDILSGKRTVLEYIWQPVAKVQEIALRD